MKQPEQRYQSFTEFWPFYVREHAERRNRMMHGVGTFLVLVVVALAAYLRNAWLLLLVPVCGYGFAWFGHFVLQKNVPATFTYPVWSLMADFKMFALMLTGRMGAEVARVQRDEPHRFAASGDRPR